MKNFGILYRYELKKICRRKLVLVSYLFGVIVMAALFAGNLMGTGYYYEYDAENKGARRISKPYAEVEAIRRDYLRSLSGRILDEELMEQLKKGYLDDEIGTIQWNLNSYDPFVYLNVIKDKNWESATAEEFYDYQSSAIQSGLDYFELSGEDRSYWEEKVAKLGSLIVDYSGGWQAMLENSSFLCLVVILLITVGLCSSFSKEHQYRTDQLLLSSLNGRKTLFLAKLAAGESLAMGVSLVSFLLYVAACGVLYGLDGFYTPIQLWTKGSLSSLNLTMGQLALLYLGLLILASLMTGTLVMLLSELFRNAIPAMLVPFLLSAVAVLNLLVGKGRLINQIISYLPTYRISYRTLTDYYLVGMGSLKMNAIQFSFVIYLVLAVLFGGLCKKCYCRYQVTGR